MRFPAAILVLIGSASTLLGASDPMTDPVYLRLEHVRARGWHPISVNGDATMEKHSTWFTIVSMRSNRVERRADNTYRVWLRWDPWPEPKTEPTYTHLVERVEVNCTSLQFRTLDSTSFNGSKPVERTEEVTKWSESVPGSIHEDVFQEACDLVKARFKPPVK